MAKKKPCDFCESEQWWSDDGVNQHHLYIEVYPDNNILGITSYALSESGETDELMAQIEMNYCPKCGRKLT